MISAALGEAQGTVGAQSGPLAQPWTLGKAWVGRCPADARRVEGCLADPVPSCRGQRTLRPRNSVDVVHCGAPESDRPRVPRAFPETLTPSEGPLSLSTYEPWADPSCLFPQGLGESG